MTTSAPPALQADQARRRRTSKVHRVPLLMLGSDGEAYVCAPTAFRPSSPLRVLDPPRQGEGDTRTRPRGDAQEERAGGVPRHLRSELERLASGCGVCSALDVRNQPPDPCPAVILTPRRVRMLAWWELMPILHPNHMLSLHAAIVSAHLSGSRTALLAGIPAEFVASVPFASTPAEQILCDLNAMNVACVLADGSVPLLTWLANAIALAGGRREMMIFQEVLNQCDVTGLTRPPSVLLAATTTSLGAIHEKPRTLSIVRIALADKKYWKEDPKPQVYPNGGPIRELCHKHFRLKDPWTRSDLCLDVTLMNRAAEPVMLNDVGVLVVSAAQVCYMYGIGTPKSYAVKIEESYVVQIPKITWKQNRSPFEGTEIRKLNQSIWSGMEDPRYLEPGAPFRFTLQLDRYIRNMPNSAVLRMIADTSLGIVESGPLHCCTG